MEKVLVIGLDGYESSLGERMMESGELPSLRKLRDGSARFLLDHGPAKRTGLAWEHVSSGMSPDDAKRWSAVYFDPHTYEIEQRGAMFVPFPARMSVKTVIFDLPYFNLSKAPEVRGITAWGAHDAGTEAMSHPAGLLDEALEKFGPYMATKWIYGFAWPSYGRCAEMGEALMHAVQQRSEMAKWLLADRFPDWDLGIVVVSELHSVIEGLWHGIDESHPLHHHPSARVAGEGVRNVYRAVDRLVGDLAATFEDCSLVVFSMHGMGRNQSDVPGMVLLPELLHRFAFGKPFFKQLQTWTNAPGGVPIIAESEKWVIETPGWREVFGRASDYAKRRIRKPYRRLLRTNGKPFNRRRKSQLMWMPAARYQPLWHKMPAFALPSYYDGSIRINLQGRERSGLVPLRAYNSFCQEIIDTLNSCRNPITGDGVVDHFVTYGSDDPLSLHPTQGDLIAVWKGSPLAFEHPEMGRIGPVPFRRTGGHTGSLGMAYVKCRAVAPGDYGTHSSFDVVPTIFDLLDQPIPKEISGDSLIRRLQ